MNTLSFADAFCRRSNRTWLSSSGMMFFLCAFAWSPLMMMVWAGEVSYRQLNHPDQGTDVASVRSLLTNTSIKILLPSWSIVHWLQLFGCLIGFVVIWVAAIWQCYRLQEEAKESILQSRRHLKADQRYINKQAENISLKGLDMIVAPKVSTPIPRETHSRVRKSLREQFDAAISPVTSSSSHDMTV